MARPTTGGSSSKKARTSKMRRKSTAPTASRGASSRSTKKGLPSTASSPYGTLRSNSRGRQNPYPSRAGGFGAPGVSKVDDSVVGVGPRRRKSTPMPRGYSNKSSSPASATQSYIKVRNPSRRNVTPGLKPPAPEKQWRPWRPGSTIARQVTLPGYYRYVTKKRVV